MSRMYAKPTSCSTPTIPIRACPENKKVWVGRSEYLSTAGLDLYTVPYSPVDMANALPDTFPEYSGFKVHDGNIRMRRRSDAIITDGSIEQGPNGMVMTLVYPSNPVKIVGRWAENLEFGVGVYERLLAGGYSPIADLDNPVRPPSSGSTYQFSDGILVIGRRDKFAPTHKLYHSTFTGFAESYSAVGSSEGIRNIGLRESAEECLLITRDKNPY